MNIKNVKKKLKIELFDIIETAVCALITVVLVFTFFARIVGVDGKSMLPTLHDKDYVLITDFFYTPKIGDIVVINLEHNFTKPIIKRVLAMEGDVVDINDEEGGLYINGELRYEDYVSSVTYTTDKEQTFPITVPEGKIFVLGDNRAESKDSRSISVGCVDKRLILGTAFFRVFPLNSIGEIK